MVSPSGLMGNPTAFSLPFLLPVSTPYAHSQAVAKSSLFPSLHSGHREARAGQDLCQTQPLPKVPGLLPCWAGDSGDKRLPPGF